MVGLLRRSHGPPARRRPLPRVPARLLLLAQPATPFEAQGGVLASPLRPRLPAVRARVRRRAAAPRPPRRRLPRRRPPQKPRRGFRRGARAGVRAPRVLHGRLRRGARQKKPERKKPRRRLQRGVRRRRGERWGAFCRQRGGACGAPHRPRPAGGRTPPSALLVVGGPPAGAAGGAFSAPASSVGRRVGVVHEERAALGRRRGLLGGSLFGASAAGDAAAVDAEVDAELPRVDERAPALRADGAGAATRAPPPALQMALQVGPAGADVLAHGATDACARADHGSFEAIPPKQIGSNGRFKPARKSAAG